MKTKEDKFDDYLKDKTTDMESDKITKKIISEYYEEEQLRDRWGKILKEKHRFGATETVVSKTADLPEIGNQKNGKRIFLITLMTAAASLLLFFYINTGQQVIQLSPVDQLLSEHYAKPFTRTVLKGPESNLTLKTEAYYFYQKEEYPKTIVALEALIAEGAQNSEDHFFLGLSYLYSQEPEKGVTQFKILLDGENNNYRDIATWYLGLALTDAKKYDEAKVYLSEVSKWTGNKGKEKIAKDAQDLIKEIEILSQ